MSGFSRTAVFLSLNNLEDPAVYWVYEDHVERLDGIGLEFNSKPEG